MEPRDSTDEETQVTDGRKVEDIYIFLRTQDPNSNKYVMAPPNIDCIIEGVSYGTGMTSAKNVYCRGVPHAIPLV